MTHENYMWLRNSDFDRKHVRIISCLKVRIIDEKPKYHTFYAVTVFFCFNLNPLSIIVQLTVYYSGIRNGGSRRGALWHAPRGQCFKLTYLVREQILLHNYYSMAQHSSDSNNILLKFQLLPLVFIAIICE